MIVSKVLSSYIFRYAMRSTLFSVLSSMFLLLIIYSLFSYHYFKGVDQGFADELTEFVAVYEAGGIDAVDGFIEQRADEFSSVQYDYMVVDSKYNKLAGSLEDWPQFTEYRDWLGFELAVLEGDTDIRHIARSVTLADGHQLLAARSRLAVFAYTRFFIGVLFSMFITTILMGTFAVFFMTWDFQRHVDRINKSIKKIMDGNLSERLIISKSGSKSSGDLQQLALHLNMMLDRIQYLMDGVKQVSDNIAHDLRTPLTRMRNNLVTFEKNCDDDDLDIVQQLIAEADNMLGTFNALQRIARVELGESGTEKTAVELDQLLEDVIELYEPVASEKSITFDVRIEKVGMMADRNLLVQAFANLLDNAVKYTPENGHIVIALSQKKHGLVFNKDECPSTPIAVLTVADNGCGIAEKNHEKVFRRFYREERSRSAQPGNGLGLSLVAAVAKLHSSKVILKPNNPGLSVYMVFY